MDILVVGNYCHDTMVRPEGSFDLLGGSSAYISQALAPVGLNFDVVSKVGTNFLYTKDVLKKPLVSNSFPTTHFIDRFLPDDHTSTLKAIAEPIYASNLNLKKARIGLACGVAMEITPESILELRKNVDFLICDVQGLIRTVDAENNVILKNISKTPFAEILHHIDLLKMNTKESAFIDVPRPKNSSWVITRGEKGTTLYESTRTAEDSFGVLETHFQPIPVKEVDSTGAGDSFIAGVSIGLARHLNLANSIQLGNQYGAYVVQYMGIPDFSRVNF